MNTMRPLVLIVVFTLGFGLPSCTDECSCPPVQGTYFSIQDVKLTNYKFISSTSMAEVAEKDTVKRENYLLEVLFQTQYVSALPHQHQAPFSLINNAYACSCLSDGINGAKEKIKSLQLITLNNFDEQHEAGTPLITFLR